MFAHSDWLVHAVADCHPGGVEAGPGGCRGEQPLGILLPVSCYGGVGVRAVEPRGHPCAGWRWQVNFWAGRGGVP